MIGLRCRVHLGGLTCKLETIELLLRDLVLILANHDLLIDQVSQIERRCLVITNELFAVGMLRASLARNHFLLHMPSRILSLLLGSNVVRVLAEHGSGRWLAWTH